MCVCVCACVREMFVLLTTAPLRLLETWEAPGNPYRRSQLMICFQQRRLVGGNLRPADAQQHLRNFVKRTEKWEGCVGKYIIYLVFSSTLSVANGAKPLTDTEFNEISNTITLRSSWCLPVVFVVPLVTTESLPQTSNHGTIPAGRVEGE